MNVVLFWCRGTLTDVFFVGFCFLPLQSACGVRKFGLSWSSSRNEPSLTL